MSDYAKFKPLQDDYLKTGSKASWDNMYLEIVRVCKITLGQICKKNKISLQKEDFDDYYLNAAMSIMGRYKKQRFIDRGGYYIKSIDRVCYDAIRTVFQNPKEVAKTKFKRTISSINNRIIEVDYECF